MLHLLLHPVHVLWRHRIDLFWPIWTTITALGVILVIWVVPTHENISRDSVQERQRVWSRKATLAVAFLILFLACYIAGSLVWEGFTYYDDSLFTLGTLAGHNIAPFIWPDQGRFFPLCLQEYNVVRHVTSSVTGYHTVRIVQLLLSCVILLILDDQLSIGARVALIVMAVITPSVLISFNGLIYSEANLILFLVCFAWCVKSFEQTRSKIWAAGALVSLQFMLYYKETVFLLVLAFAVGRLILRCWRADKAGWDLARLREPESRLDMCFAGMAVLFLLYYLVAMFPKYRTSYEDVFHLPFLQVVSGYLKIDLLAWIFVAVALARILLIVRGKVPPSLLWDGLAFGAVAYVAGYLALRMQSAYYFAPVDLIAVLYLGRLTLLCWGRVGTGSRLCALALLILVLFQDLSLSAFRMYERKNVIHAKAEIARVIKARYENNPQNVKRLFFPFAHPTQLAEFGAYLNYRGVPMEQDPANSTASGGVIMAGEVIHKDGPCEHGKPVVCRSRPEPEPGDLVVLLPDDLTQTNKANWYRQGSSTALFSYHPRPSIPQWLMPYVNRLHVVSPLFSRVPLPDSFLNASVTVWK